MKKKLLLLVTCVVVIAVSFSLVGCNKGKNDLLKELDSFTFWQNKVSQAVAQKNVNDIVMDFMNSDSQGKTKKVAILGYDGARADSLVNIFPSGVTDKSGDIFSGIVTKPKYSGMNELVNMGGGAYISFAGGEKGTESEQDTSTIWGWSSILSGKWAYQNGINLPISATKAEKEAHSKKMSLDSKTFLLRLAEQNNMRTTFSASWPMHFDETYINEVEYLKIHPEITMNYNKVSDDYALHEYLLQCVTEGSAVEKDIIFGIYEAPDYNGHYTDFTNDNSHYTNAMKNIDNYCYEVIEKIKERSSYENEDWLILMTTDHGGNQTWHGEQNVECRTTWIVSNKKIDSKYFSSNYDGYKNK